VPNANPLYPQSETEVMARRTSLLDSRAETPRDLEEAVIGARTAPEVDWLK
jgi:hypothetical protein